MKIKRNGNDYSQSVKELDEFAEKWGLNPEPIEKDPLVITKPGAETEEARIARFKRFGLTI